MAATQRKRRTTRVPTVGAGTVQKKKAPLKLPISLVLIALIGIVFFTTFSSKGQQTGAQAGVAATDGTQSQGDLALELNPTEPVKSSVLRLSAKGFESSAARYEWMIDGIPVSTNGDPMTLSLSETLAARKGAVISAVAIVGDREILSNEVRVGNSTPQLASIRFADQPRPNDPLCVTAEAVDADGDAVRYEYEWTVNGAAAGTENRLDRKFRRGDRIIARVTAFDDETQCGTQAIERIIKNMPPEIAESREYRFENDLFEYQARASDPDGDPLTYALEACPAGMSIDAKTGLVKWQAPSTVSGKQRISIVVTDGQGGRATYDLDFTIQ
jgi:hypothetical protein